MTIEQYYDNLYERAESVNQNEPVECKECEGSGGWSSCCGAEVTDSGSDTRCTDCLSECKIVTCHVCKGNGEIED